MNQSFNSQLIQISYTQEIHIDKDLLLNTNHKEEFVAKKNQLMNSTIKPIINQCALEFRTKIKDKGASYSIMTATKIKKDVNVDYLKLPEKFKIKK